MTRGISFAIGGAAITTIIIIIRNVMVQANNGFSVEINVIF